jgi:transcription-repair coupling factor (superfamily II helicase)
MLARTSALDPPTDRLAAALQESPARVQLRGALHGRRAQLLAELVTRLERSLVCVVQTPDQADALAADLRFFLPADGPVTPAAVKLFPQWEILPYEQAELNPALVRARVETLHAARGAAPCCVVTTPRALLQKLPKVVEFDRMQFTIKVGERWSLEGLIARLLEASYRQTGFVEAAGEFAHRGGILDLYSPRHDRPVRLELFDDEIESIRFFDPLSQRSARHLDACHVGPTRELLLTEARRLEAAERCAQRSPRLAEGLRHSAPPSGVEQLFSLFHDGYHTLFDYFASDPLCFRDQPGVLMGEAAAFAELVAARRDLAAVDRPILAELAPPVVAPVELFESFDLLDCIDGLSPLAEASPDHPVIEDDARAVTIVGDGLKARLRNLRSTLGDWATHRPVFLPCLSPGQADRMQRLLTDLDLPAELLAGAGPPSADAVPGIYTLVGEISRSFAVGETGPVYLAEADLGGAKVHLRVKKPTSVDEVLQDFRALKMDDYVVHLQHGIGQYAGLATLTAARITAEFLEIRYAKGDKVFIPIGELAQVSRYVGEEGRAPTLSTLGTGTWERIKAQTRKGVELVARELVELYAVRQAATGFPFSSPTDAEYLAFEATFPFEETPDQEVVIHQVLEDMAMPQPMDRLVCGDVGFGKTEVALRAACRCVLDGKQVVLLAPTTLLAQQHYHNFTERFASLPVRIGHLSRLLPPKEQRQVVDQVADGRIDILIGTHRLLSRDLRLHDLGLIIIDEEQRFGVRQKERLKELKTRADCLTLTATPIPRTLHMALTGIRPISIINTPPHDRLPITTRIIRRDEAVLADALARELARGGQVYWVHNRVQSIGRAAEQVARLAPRARVAIAHGQMDKQELSHVMTAFRDREHDILVCTSIIESGIDLPRVNTIVVERADTFGLAQLYQLRGRVGRGVHQAYAYLITPAESALGEDAQERLTALAEHTQLGSGFHIAAHDLEIRGGGNLLGAQQSGKIAAVGYDLYVKLVEESVASLMGREVEEVFLPKVTLDLSAYLPSDYVRDAHERLHLYQELATFSQPHEIEEAFAALVDRYGRPPQEVYALFLQAESKIAATAVRAEEVKLTADGLLVHFSARSVLDPQAVLRLKENYPDRVQLIGEYSLRLVATEHHRDDVARRVRDCLALLEDLRDARPQY